MTTTRRAELSRIMGEAWGWFRSVGGSFADALRTAWKRHRIRTQPAFTVHKVKPWTREALSPLRDTARVLARANANKSAWYGSKVATW